ncbi:MAG: hypothetical protein WCC87_20555 [Candidatus Korobacteraceae bacterium]
MPFTKNAGAISKKQAPMPGPKSVAYKKIVAARKRTMAGKSAARQARNQRPKTPVFSTLKARQSVVERIKREIWASVQEINQAIINLALAGNYNAAKALFDFAGVYNLPAPEEAAPALALPQPSLEPAAVSPSHPVDAFLKSIGMEPVGDEPDPGMTA